MATKTAATLQAVSNDVLALKSEYVEHSKKLEALSQWLKANWEPTFDDLKGLPFFFCFPLHDF
jgi:hypothetical protein